MRGLWAALIAAVVVMAGAGTLWLVTDLDQDGLSAAQENQLGTSPTVADSDGDGLTDGWEQERGLSPLAPDGDTDGLSDGTEVALGTDPFLVDSDGDGRTDAAEPQRDCDADGFAAAVDADDDSDQRPDRDESLAASCDPDQDRDGVLDGLERAVRCIQDPDCDDDGLSDGDEVALGFDPLDPDTFGLGLGDAVALAFQEAGQPASRDEDGDGIPDHWEDTEGLVRWRDFDPTAGRRDMLVEYLFVRGPDSDDYDIDLSPSYELVESMFEFEGDMDLQWVETEVRLPFEPRPSFLDDSDRGLLFEILETSTYAANPYVTTVVLNPQQEQAHPFDILGAAFLRSMLAVVDYGAHTVFTFEPGDSDGLSYSDDELEVSPVIESRIIAAELELIDAEAFAGFDEAGVDADGNVFLYDAEGAGGRGIRWSWEPEWFQTAPNVTTDDGAWLQFDRAGFQVAHGSLAGTIAHELGHTLGLCHAHEASCWDRFSPQDQIDHDTSTMSYNAPSNQLHFLASEWDQVHDYLSCPPQDPILLLAEGASPADVADAKYDAAFEGETTRQCGDYSAIVADLVAVPEATHHSAPVSLRDPPTPSTNGVLATVAYFGAVVLASAVVGVVVWAVVPRRRV